MMSEVTADSLLVLGRDAVRRLLPMKDCIALLRDAMVRAIDPDARLPLRSFLPIPGREDGMGIMPGYLPGADVLGAKVITVFPANFERGLPSHQGVVLMFDTDTGRPAALVDGGEVTAIRTAAATALATDILARPDAAMLTILGYGEQARQHLESISLVRDLKGVRVWGRSIERATAFAEREGAAFPFPVQPVASLADAISGADIVCATTASTDAYLPGALFEPGMHVNLVGSSRATEREADDEAVVRARVYVDYLPSTMAQAGEILSVLRAGLIGEDHIVGQVGEVIAGTAPGRTDPGQITLYKSLGIAAQDLACVDHLYRQAQSQGPGTGAWVPF
jgi:ornithine cyclodeaminase/alanine dehydrogenase-like protein (mu-crystallin family)